MKINFWKSKSAESFNNSLPAKSADPVTLIFKDAMTELLRTKSKSSAVQTARVERVLEISSDKQIKILEKILRIWRLLEQQLLL